MATYGIDAVTRLIDDADLEYPVSVDRLVREHALANVDIDEDGNSIMLGELMNAADVREFADEEDVGRKLAPVFDRLREERQATLIERLVGIFT